MPYRKTFKCKICDYWIEPVNSEDEVPPIRCGNCHHELEMIMAPCAELPGTGGAVLCAPPGWTLGPSRPKQMPGTDNEQS